MKISQYYSFNLARTEQGQLVELNVHDSGHIMGVHEPRPIKGMGHIKTRLYLWICLHGYAGVYSIGDLIKARKAYLACDSCEVVNDELPIRDDWFKLGKAIHLDVYGGKEIKIYYVN